jgi:hypothetical protein
MAIAIRDDVATGPLYSRLIERLLREGRTANVIPCPRANCPRSYFVFCLPGANADDINHAVTFFADRTHGDHDPICTLDEPMPPEMASEVTGLGSG